MPYISTGHFLWLLKKSGIEYNYTRTWWKGAFCI